MHPHSSELHRMQPPNLFSLSQHQLHWVSACFNLIVFCLRHLNGNCKAIKLRRARECMCTHGNCLSGKQKVMSGMKWFWHKTNGAIMIINQWSLRVIEKLPICDVCGKFVIVPEIGRTGQVDVTTISQKFPEACIALHWSTRKSKAESRQYTLSICLWYYQSMHHWYIGTYSNV